MALERSSHRVNQITGVFLQVLLYDTFLFPGKMVQQREKEGSDFSLCERLEGLSYLFPVSGGITVLDFPG
jgi:hypothetical protein